MWLRNGNPTASVGVGGSGGVGWSSMRVIFPGGSQAAINLHTAWAMKAAFRQGFQTAEPGANDAALWNHTQGVPSGYGNAAALLPLAPGGVRADLSGVGAFTGTKPQEGRIVTADLVGGGVLSTATVIGVGLIYSSPSGSGVLAADAVASGVVLAALTGSGTLAGAVEGGAAVVAALQGTGVLVAQAEGGALVVALLDGTGTLAGNAEGGAQAQALLIGAGALSAAIVGVMAALADLEGGSSFTATVEAIGVLSAALEGDGLLDIDAPIGIGFAEAHISDATGGLVVDTLSAGALQQVVASILGALIVNYDDPDSVGRVLNDMHGVNAGRVKLNKTTGVLTVYAPDGVTPRLTFQVKDDDGNPSSSQQYDREPT